MLLVAEQTTDEVGASRDEIVLGYLRGVAELACQTAQNIAPVRDETRIGEVLHGQQRHRFWSQLRKMVGRKAPPPHLGWQCFSHGFVTHALAHLYFALRWGGFDWIEVALILSSIAAAVWFHRHADVNPRGIVTFGDLARHLAGQNDRTRAS